MEEVGSQLCKIEREIMMRELILEKLAEIEQAEDIRTLHAIRLGSR